jgi:curved DNA-binding protein CbpA
VLGLRPGATARQINVAYRILVKVWHPDRFEGDPALREVAEAKLKEINSAYAELSSTTSSGGAGEEPRRAPRGPSPRRPDAARERSAEHSRPDKPMHGVAPVRDFGRWVVPSIAIFLRVILFALAVLLGRYLWIAFDVQGTAGQGVADVYGYGKQSSLKELEAPRERFENAVRQDLRKLNFLHFSSAADGLPQAAGVTSTGEEQAGQTTHRLAVMRQPASGQDAAHTVYPYITLGSTRDEVLTQQGTPTAATEDKLVYGRSELDFKHNRVIGWKIDPVSSPIRVKLWPGSAVDPGLDFFTIGDSKDVVLAVQGTPTAFSADKFEYGGSAVYFQDNLVVSWKSDPGSIPLRAKRE